jgi:hypothetical protein
MKKRKRKTNSKRMMRYLLRSLPKTKTFMKKTLTLKKKTKIYWMTKRILLSYSGKKM